MPLAVTLHDLRTERILKSEKHDCNYCYSRRPLCYSNDGILSLVSSRPVEMVSRWSLCVCLGCLLQHICRRLLAVYNLPSWGRCELALSLLLEENAPYSLEDVVQAVRESHDREFIKRVLTKECPICLSIFPHSKVTVFPPKSHNQRIVCPI